MNQSPNLFVSRLIKSLLAPTGLIVSFLLVFAVLATEPLEDGDFYWHSATGNWIINHRELPQHDPFSYTTYRFATSEEEREQIVFFLQQYWLGQVVLNSVQRLGGEGAIVAFRMLVYTLLVAWFFIFVHKRAEGNWLALLATLAFADLLLAYPGERPTLFTLLFFFTLLNILERSPRLGADERITAPLLLLPILMVLWSNMHGGYVIGVALIMAYLVGGFWENWRARRAVDWRLAGLFGISVLATGLNPNGFMAIEVSLNMFTPGVEHRVYEFLSPLRAAQLYGNLYPAYWVFLGTGAVILIWRHAYVRPAHVFAFCGIALLSFLGMRNMIFLPMAWALLIGFLPEAPRLDRVLKGAAVMIMAVWVVLQDYHQVLSFNAHPDFPLHATRFLKEIQPPGPIYNKYEWGGYLIQNLPEYPVFIDGRGLSSTVSRMDDAILWSQEWNLILEEFEVETLLISGVSAHSGKIFPLARNLYASDTWKLLYYDDAAMVFVRRESWAKPLPPGGNAEGKAGVLKHLLARCQALEGRIPESAELWASKAEVLLLLGRSTEARAAAVTALRFNPLHQEAKRVLLLSQ